MSVSKSLNLARTQFDVVAQFGRAWALVVAALREIFDESAYRRFLTQRGIASSREAYAEFLRDGQALRERRPRCC